MLGKRAVTNVNNSHGIIRAPICPIDAMTHNNIIVSITENKHSNKTFDSSIQLFIKYLEHVVSVDKENNNVKSSIEFISEHIEFIKKNMDNHLSQMDSSQLTDDDEYVENFNINNTKFIDTEKSNDKLAISHLFYKITTIPGEIIKKRPQLALKGSPTTVLMTCANTWD